MAVTYSGWTSCYQTLTSYPATPFRTHQSVKERKKERNRAVQLPPSAAAMFCGCAQVAGAQDIRAIACGAFHNMALSRSGEVFTWGTNDYGQLGNGSTSYSIAPCKVGGCMGLVTWHHATCTFTHMCVLPLGPVGYNGCDRSSSAFSGLYWL